MTRRAAIMAALMWGVAKATQLGLITPKVSQPFEVLLDLRLDNTKDPKAKITMLHIVANGEADAFRLEYNGRAVTISMSEVMDALGAISEEGRKP